MGNYLDIFEELKKEHEQAKVDTINSRILIVDGLNTFIRAFSIDPTCNENGAHIGGISGFLKSIGYAIKILNPTRGIIVCVGKGGSTRRRKIYPDYKSKRKVSVRYNRAVHISNQQDESESMKMQIGRLLQYLECLPISILIVDNIEADDTISYLATAHIDNDDSKFFIMSSDKDFYQLIADNISVWSPTKKKLYTEENLLEEYGISANNFLMYRILDGDTSDNISGVNGVGLKTLQKKFPILSEHTEVSINELLDYSKDKKGKVFENIIKSKDILERNFKLMQLKNVDISATAKSKIQESYRRFVKETNRHKFRVMVLEDQLSASIPNIETWITTCFNTLNSFILSKKD